METERDRKIRDRAYALWIEGGRQEGRSHEHWLQAEQEYAGGSEGPDLPTEAVAIKAGRAKAAAGGMSGAKGNGSASGKPAASKENGAAPQAAARGASAGGASAKPAGGRSAGPESAPKARSRPAASSKAGAASPPKS